MCQVLKVLTCLNESFLILLDSNTNEKNVPLYTRTPGTLVIVLIFTAVCGQRVVTILRERHVP